VEAVIAGMALEGVDEEEAQHPIFQRTVRTTSIAAAADRASSRQKRFDLLQHASSPGRLIMQSES
jgi:hypothetical protein